jgi:hypothetical protein
MRISDLPPPTVIPSFDPRFFRPCTFPLLRELGYGTRVTVNNGVGSHSPFATPMTVSMTAFDNAGGTIGSTPEIATLAPGELERVRVSAEELATWPVRHPEIPHVRIGLEPLLTGNGKPYVIMRYADGPPSLHHG